MSLNISQTLFRADEKIAKQDESNVSAYINQSRISTYYKDNPIPILSASGQYGISTLGGPIDGSVGSGSRPGQTFKIAPVKVEAIPENNIQLVNKGGIWVPSGMGNFT
jgi:hypothetical protein